MSGGPTFLTVGDRVECTRTLSAADIAIFAEISGDHDPVHTDEVFARTTAFGRIIAHGALVMGLPSAAASMMSKRSVDRGATGTPVSAGYDRVRFTRPVFAGDTLTVRYTIESVDDAAARTRAKVEVTNAAGDICVVATHILAWVTAPPSG
ncbi:acyl dehydratase [Humitalea rosea]|uniref:Acyl dehydratase n=1 Tax=Humitalea rosea TaxID=990373 RepID=A0A2W7J9T9_9PROT|nr:MaoC/PaaZ C-terminal domain-containing protein [Humitalea rosea]PZW48109.1 acyl dehydratase [Humitalea rosea]